jgi:hypothetical protein
MIYRLKVIMYLVSAALLVAASGGGYQPAMAVGYHPAGGGVGLNDNLTILASRTWSPALAASTNLSATVYSWAKTWGGNASSVQANNIVVDGASNLYVTGEYTGTVAFNPAGGASHTSNGAQDAFLSKFASDGTFQWVKTWGGTGRDVSNGIVVDSSGNVYVSGPFVNTVDFNPSGGASHTSNAGGMNNIFLSKFASDGTFQWVKTWGPSDGGAEGYSIAIDGSNNVYVVGDFSGTTCDFNPWGTHDVHTNHPTDPSWTHGPLFDAYLSKFDSSGNFLWAKTWGGEGYDDGPGVAVDGLGNVYVGGMYASQTINFDPAGGLGGLGHPAHDSGIVVDVFLSKFNSSGIFQWVRTWGGQGTDEVGQTVTVDRSNNVYVAGRFGCTNCDFNPGPGGTADLRSSHGGLDAFVSKFDASGTFQWAKTWGGTGWDSLAGLTTDGSNNVYATGIFANTVDFGSGSGVSSQGQWDAFLSKFDSSGNFQGAETWGGPGDDGCNKLARDAAGNVYVAGWFQNTVDFDPGSGVDNHTAMGGKDAFLSMFTPSLSSLELWGRPGDRTIYLDWQVNVTLPITATWTISYAGGPGSPASPITGLVEPTRAYAITNTTNYIWYDMTLNAMVGGSAVLTATVQVMPTDKFVYLPLVQK